MVYVFLMRIPSLLTTEREDINVPPLPTHLSISVLLHLRGWVSVPFYFLPKTLRFYPHAITGIRRPEILAFTSPLLSLLSHSVIQSVPNVPYKSTRIMKLKYYNYCGLFSLLELCATLTSSQGVRLLTMRSGVRFPALPKFYGLDLRRGPHSLVKTTGN